MKIFCIGLSKTGTTSLTEALRILGFDSYHWPLSSKELARHEALTDITVSCRFRELDRSFSGSKFIYTIRDRPSWLRSCRAHWEYLEKQREALALPAFAIEAELALFGTLNFNEQVFRAAYRRHHESVMAHFRYRQRDMLVINIVAGEGWGKLCQFLGKPIPAMKFPRANARATLHPEQ
jgi:hypothetical protein